MTDIILTGLEFHFDETRSFDVDDAVETIASFAAQQFGGNLLLVKHIDPVNNIDFGNLYKAEGFDPDNASEYSPEDEEE